MADWFLIDYGTPLERAEDDERPSDSFAKTVIESEEQLRAELARLRRGRPALLSLFRPSRPWLSIGLGPELSGLHWQGGRPGGGFKYAVNPRPLTDEHHRFEDGDDGAGFPPWGLFPTDVVVEAVLEFYRTGRLSDALHWEE
jgi:hypothetical protein